MSRRLRSSRAPAERPTFRKILDQACAVLRDDGFDLFNVQRVLDGAHISRATLYRHFPDVDGLIEAAPVENFRRDVYVNLSTVTGLVAQVHDNEAFRNGIRAVIQSLGHLPARLRLQRTHTIVLGSTRPELAAAVASVQEELTSGWESAILQAKERGFVRTDLDVRAVAVLILSLTLGRIVDDAAAHQLDNGRWAAAFFDIVDRSFLQHDAD